MFARQIHSEGPCRASAGIMRTVNADGTPSRRAVSGRLSCCLYVVLSPPVSGRYLESAGVRGPAGWKAASCKALRSGDATEAGNAPCRGGPPSNHLGHSVQPAAGGLCSAQGLPSRVKFAAASLKQP